MANIIRHYWDSLTWRQIWKKIFSSYQWSHGETGLKVNQFKINKFSKNNQFLLPKEWNHCESMYNKSFSRNFLSNRICKYLIQRSEMRQAGYNEDFLSKRSVTIKYSDVLILRNAIDIGYIQGDRPVFTDLLKSVNS